MLKVEIVGNNVNVDWIDFCKEGKCATAAIVQKARFATQGVQSYRVYGLNGSFVGIVKAADAHELQANARDMVRNSGVYIARPMVGGAAFRVRISK